MLFKFQLDTEKYLRELNSGPGLSPLSQINLM